MLYKEIKTAELTGPALDWAVAKCEGFALEYEADQKDFWIIRTNHAAQFFPPFGYLRDIFHPSSDWSQCGPIIEREGLCLIKTGTAWQCTTNGNELHSHAKEAPEPLIAALRCYVASKLGDAVSIPVELLEVS